MIEINTSSLSDAFSHCYFQKQKKNIANEFASNLRNPKSILYSSNGVGEFISEPAGLFSLSENNYWSLFSEMINYFILNQSDHRSADIIYHILFVIEDSYVRHSYVSFLNSEQKKIVATVLKDIYVKFYKMDAFEANIQANKVLSI